MYDLIEKEVVRVNRSLPEAARIQKFVLLYKEFDPDDGELTRTRKLRRNFIAERYQHEIEALYRNVNEVHVESEIQYQDGKTTTIVTDLHIRRMKPMDQYALESERKWWQFLEACPLTACQAKQSSPAGVPAAPHGQYLLKPELEKSPWKF